MWKRWLPLGICVLLGALLYAGIRLAEVRDIRPLGAITRVTLKIKDQDELIEAEVVKDHDSLSGMTRGETLYFRPKVWQRQAAL